jgi:threonine synthase
MFADKEFSASIKMSGVNSINWSRIVVQIVYYFFSYFKIAKEGKKINFSVPTGNFGDIYAGYVAKKMGLPINKLIIATNNNDILKRVFNTGIYKPLKVKHTISPSMDIQVASNFERLIFDICSCDSNETLKLMNDLNERGEFTLKKENLNKIHANFLSDSLSEEETRLVISEIYKKERTLIDPHTAVAVGIANQVSLEGEIVVLGTAHPAKFSDVVMKETSKKPELPENLKDILDQKEKFEELPKDLKKIKDYILDRV